MILISWVKCDNPGRSWPWVLEDRSWSWHLSWMWLPCSHHWLPLQHKVVQRWQGVLQIHSYRFVLRQWIKYILNFKFYQLFYFGLVMLGGDKRLAHSWTSLPSPSSQYHLGLRGIEIWIVAKKPFIRNQLYPHRYIHQEKISCQT